MRQMDKDSTALLRRNIPARIRDLAVSVLLGVSVSLLLIKTKYSAPLSVELGIAVAVLYASATLLIKLVAHVFV